MDPNGRQLAEEGGGRDEEYGSPIRAASSWLVLWWCKQVTAHGALTWGRAGTCTCMLTYIDTHRAELTHRQTDNRVTKFFSLLSTDSGDWKNCKKRNIHST